MVASVFRAVAALLVGFWLPGLPLAAASEEDRGIYVEVRESNAADASVADFQRLYGASHALVIGIDDYTNGWPRLSNAVKDAQLVAGELEARGFQVQTLTDVTGAELRRELRQFFALKGADPEARLFVWYAGHGHTEAAEGFLVPADAPLPEDPDFLVSALPIRDFGSLVRLAKAKHAMAVFDSCFSGTIFTVQRSLPPSAITWATGKPVRQFLTSGDADQLVSDDGTFRRLFLSALRGEEPADANEDGYLTGSELGLYLEDRMINLTDRAQTPRSGKLRDQRFDRGDFVFLLPSTAGGGGPPQKDGEAKVASNAGLSGELAVELKFWESIEDSRNPADFRAYMDQFGERGRFSSLARVRLRSLAARPDDPEPADPPPAPAAAPQQAPAEQIAEPATQEARLGGGETERQMAEIERYIEADWRKAESDFRNYMIQEEVLEIEERFRRVIAFGDVEYEGQEHVIAVEYGYCVRDNYQCRNTSARSRFAVRLEDGKLVFRQL